jgi:two-component system, OmpR family, sensor kinase
VRGVRREIPHGAHGAHGAHGRASSWHGGHAHRGVLKRNRLQRRLFLWFGATIALTAVVVGVVVGTLGPGSRRWYDDYQRFQEFGSEQFARVWRDPAALRDLTQGVARAFKADVTVTDASGRELERVGARCSGGYSLEVRRGSELLGSVNGCLVQHHHPPFGFLLGLAVGAGVLWASSFAIARRLTRPLAELERVTRAIGSGDLAARVRLGRHQPGEVGALADSVNEMAGRIERQLKEERALLAAVSHELRSPLARLRVLVELAGGDGLPHGRLAEIEAEIVGIDALIGKLLASSRLEFGALALQTLDAETVGRRALEAQSLPAELCETAAPGARVEVDPTLVGRALGNLLENAKLHAGGVERLRVTAGEGHVRFEVLDRGPGFTEEVLRRAFEPFYSTTREDGARGASLGLGLALVARIAKAHGGRAFAENRPDGGARSVLELPASRPS